MAAKIVLKGLIKKEHKKILPYTDEELLEYV